MVISDNNFNVCKEMSNVPVDAKKKEKVRIEGLERKETASWAKK